MSSYPPHYAYPSAPPVVRALPHPPRLHWGWVLGLSIITIGFFGIAWLLVQALWVRKMRGGKSAAFVWAVVYAAFIPTLFVAGMAVGAFGARYPESAFQATQLLQGFAGLGGFVLFLGTVFSLRAEMEREPINIPLGGGMTLFFGPVYFQYHLYDYGLEGGGGSTKTSAVTGLGLGGAAAVERESGS